MTDAEKKLHNDSIKESLNELAEYKSTGLTPDDVRALVDKPKGELLLEKISLLEKLRRKQIECDALLTSLNKYKENYDV